MSTIFIYSTSTGTSGVMHKTERAQQLIDGNGGRGRTSLVYLDIEQEKRQKVWDVSGKKGIYPLIFVDERFVGTPSRPLARPAPSLIPLSPLLCSCLF